MKSPPKFAAILALFFVTILSTATAPSASGQVPPAARQPRAATRENALAKRVKPLRKPSDPEAAALLLNLIARYAADVPDKTDLDRKIEAALGGSPESRRSAQRMIDKFHKLPQDFRQTTYGQYATITTQPFERARYEAAFGRVLQSLPRIDPGPTGPRTSLPMALGTEPTYMVRYRGMACFAETDWDQSSGSDEIYEIDVVAFKNENGEWVTNTVKQPQNKDYYAPVDAGGSYPGPFTILYDGPARELTFSSMFFEQDFGNANEQRDVINTGVKAGLTAACAALIGGACSSAPVSTIVGYIAKVLGDLIADILDFEDDLIDEDHFIVPRDQLIAWGTVQPPPLDDRGMKHHFEIIHEGEGAFDKTYFEVVRTEPDIPDLGQNPVPPPRGFVPAPQTSARSVEGAWGDTISENTSKVVVVITGTPSGSGTFSARSREHLIGGSDVTASGDGLQLNQDGTWSWVGPLFDMATIAQSAPGGVRGTDVLGGLSGRRTKTVSASDMRVPGGRAFTIYLPNNVRLQSFIEDRPPEEVKNYRMRYVRLNDQGRIVTDVMLMRTQMTPR